MRSAEIGIRATTVAHTRPRYFTPKTFWIYRPRLSSHIFGVALRIILAQTTVADCGAAGLGHRGTVLL